MATDRLRTNFLGGVVENPSGLTASDTQIQSSALATMTQVPHNELTISVISLDPFRRAGPPEIAVVTSHTAGANTAVISRGQDSTLPRPHALGTEWLQGPVVSDWTELNDGWIATQKAVEEAVRKRDFSARGQLVVGTGPGDYGILSIGPEDTVPVARAESATGVAWERLTWEMLTSALQDALQPAGTMLPWLGAGPPSYGWLTADGTEHPKLGYPRLDAVLAYGGYPWGQSEDGTMFRLPNMTGRTVTGGYPGEFGGSATVSLNVLQLAAHNHPDTFAVGTAKVETDAREAEAGEGVIFQPATYLDLENAFGVSHVPEDAPQIELFEHTHPLLGDVGYQGKGDPVDVRNPYATVQWIVKT